MTLAEWLERFPDADFRSTLAGPKHKAGDILCVPHGPWIYFMGQETADENGAHKMLVTKPRAMMST